MQREASSTGSAANRRAVGSSCNLEASLLIATWGRCIAPSAMATSLVPPANPGKPFLPSISLETGVTRTRRLANSRRAEPRSWQRRRARNFRHRGKKVVDSPSGRRALTAEILGALFSGPETTSRMCTGRRFTAVMVCGRARKRKKGRGTYSIRSFYRPRLALEPRPGLTARVW